MLLPLRAITPAILLVALASCRSHDPTVELLESELRWMEDNLYELDYQLDMCQEQLASARRYNASLRKALAETRREGPRAVTDEDDQLPYDMQSEEDLYRFDAPVIELGEPDAEEGAADDTVPSLEEDSGLEPELERPIPVPGRMPDLDVPPEIDDPVDPLDDVTAIRTESGRVAEIRLNPRLTGGYDFDGRPGHEGVMVVIEPYDTAGHYRPVPGELIVEVTDPRHKGMARQVAYWHFDATEAAAFFKDTLFGRGAHLTLPWPAQPPPARTLELTVTYEPLDGPQLSAEKTIEIR